MVLNCELDIVSREVIHEVVDLDLPAVLPIELIRRYVSSTESCGILGFGWASNFPRLLTLEKDRITVHDPIGGDKIYSLEGCDGQHGPQLIFPDKRGSELALKY